MRRFLALVFVLCLAIPAGVSISGCTRNTAGKYCSETSGYGLLQTQVASISYQPAIAGISLAYGQTTETIVPTATTCTGKTVPVAIKDYSFGTTNNQLVDISPTGNLCAGTWNRNTGGGIADYTYCTPPNPLPKTNGLPYAVAYITATADSVTSNPVAVYVHPQVSSVSLYVPPPPSSTSNLSCYSQGTIALLDAQACYTGSNGTQYELCAPAAVTSGYSCPLPPGVTSVPTCESSIGTMTFAVGTSNVASLNSTSNQITAEQPGTTVITASIAGSGSSAGYFSTCPPASITTTLSNGNTSGTVTQGVPQTLTTTVLDTNGNVITGLGLTYQSTNPIDIQVGSNGQITNTYPGSGAITAICEPGTCNPAPTNLIGYNGTGVPISSNTVNLTTPGTASDYVWFAAPGASLDFTSVELLNGTISSTTAMPYVPNSMLMDGGGNSLYFGSAREMMVYSTTTNALTSQVGIPGVVLAVSPNNSQVLINDQSRHLFYIYNVSAGTFLTFPGMGNAAQWTPDSQTLYITDNQDLNTRGSCGTGLITGHTDALYVYNANTGWSTYTLPSSPLPLNAQPACNAQPNTAAALPGPTQTPAVMIPSVGAYLRGVHTTVHTWCPTGTVGNQATIQYYPEGDPLLSNQPNPVSNESDALAATLDGNHILGASLNGSNISLADIAISIPGVTTTTSSSATATLPLACPLSVDPTTGTQTMSPLTITPTNVNTVSISGVNANWIDQVVTGSTPVSTSGGAGSGLAFITYNGSTPGASLPYYLPVSGGVAGASGSVTLTDCPQTLNNAPNPSYPCNSNITAPIAGAFSPDHTIFFVSTSGDNEVHYISIPNAITTPSSVPTDSNQISPNLPGCDPNVDAGCTYTGTPGTAVPATVIQVKPRATT